MHQYSYPNSLERLLHQYDVFGYGSHNPERSLAVFVEKFSIGDYIFTPVYEM